MSRAEVDVTAVLTFGDDEDIIGRACRRVADHLRSLGLRFEIVAVDADSGDNSHSVLALVRDDVPELRVIGAPSRDRGFAAGAAEARGKVVWLVDAPGAMSPLAPFTRAHRFVSRGQADAVVVKGRFSVCYRAKCRPVIEALRGRGAAYHARLARKLRARGLEVDVHELGASRTASVAQRPWSRLLDVLSTARATWSS